METCSCKFRLFLMKYLSGYVSEAGTSEQQELGQRRPCFF